MHKLLSVGITIGAVIMIYLVMLIVVPFLADTTVSVNATMAAGSNMTNYPGTSSFMLSIPWILWFVPGACGIVIVVGILRAPD